MLYSSVGHFSYKDLIMKKLLICVAILLLTAALIGPKFSGNIFNQGLDIYILSLNKSGAYHAKVVNREQGWFHTVADIVVVQNIPNANDSSQLLSWNVKLQAAAQHGPVLTKSGISLGWLDWEIVLRADELPSSLTIQSDEPLYQATGKMSLLGATRYQDSIAAMTYHDEATSIVAAIDGWQGSGTLSNNAVVYSGGPGNLRMSLPNVYALELSALKLDFNAQSPITDLLEGSFYDAFAVISLQDASIENMLNQTSTQLNNLRFASATDFDESTGLADATVEITLSELRADDTNLTDLTLEAELNNMQESFFRAYQKMNKDIIRSPQRTQEIMHQTMRTHLLGQLQVNPELNIIKFNGVFNSGNISLTSNNQLINVSDLPANFESNDFWVKHIQSSTDIALDEGAAVFIAKALVKARLATDMALSQVDPIQIEEIVRQQSATSLDTLVKQGLVTKANGTYRFSFTLQDGKATLNNSVIPLSM